MAVLLLLYLVAEGIAVWVVGSLVGFLPTVGLLLVGAFVGSWLARREGGKAFRAFVQTARAGKPAHAEITNGLLVALGGLLIMIPGFISDIAGLLLLLPSRAIFRKAWLRKAERDAARAPHQGHTAYPFEQQRRTIVVDSEVVDSHTVDGETADGDTGNPRPRHGDTRSAGGAQPGFGMSK